MRVRKCKAKKLGPLFVFDVLLMFMSYRPIKFNQIWWSNFHRYPIRVYHFICCCMETTSKFKRVQKSTGNRRNGWRRKCLILIKIEQRSLAVVMSYVLMPKLNIFNLNLSAQGKHKRHIDVCTQKKSILKKLNGKFVFDRF